MSHKNRVPAAALIVLVLLMAVPTALGSMGPVPVAPTSRSSVPATSTVVAPSTAVASLASPTVPSALRAAIHPAGGSPTIWTNLSKGSPATPGGGNGLQFAAMASDPAANITLLFGGYATNSASATIYPLSNSTWEFWNGAWKDITSTAGVAPSPRFSTNLVYDTNDGYFLLWGGMNLTKGAGHYLTDTWTFSPTTGTWTNVTATVGTAPTGLFQPSMAYDIHDKEAVLFGGAVGGNGDNGKGAKAYQETWTYSNLVWTNRTTALGAAQPAARYGASMAYDAYDQEVVLFGGLKTASTIYADTWAFKANAWTDETPAVQNATNNPVPAKGVNLATDNSDGGYVLLFGGFDSNSTARNETWVFFNQTWSNITRYVGLPPPLPGATFDGGSSSAAMAYDNYTKSVILFGGYTYFSGGFYLTTENTTWSYQWSNVSVSLSANRTQIPQGQPVTFTASARGGTFLYKYAYNNDTHSGLGALPTGCTTVNASTFTCSPSEIGYFNITVGVVDTHGATGQSVDVPIHIFPPFTDILNISKNSIDYGGQVTLTTSFLGGTGKGVTYAYSGLPAGCGSSNTPSLVCHPKGSTGAIGNFSITVKVTDSVGDIAKSNGAVNLTVWGSLTLSLAGGPIGPGKQIQMDAGSTLYLNASGSGGDALGPYSYLWTGLPAGCVSQNVSLYTCTPSTSLILNYTIYPNVRVYLTDAGNTTLNASVAVKVWPQLQASVNAAPLSGHSPLTVSFFGNVTGGWQPDSAYWLTDGGRTLGGYPDVNATFVFTYSSTGGPSANTHEIQFWANDTSNISLYRSVNITVLPAVSPLGANVSSTAVAGLAEIGQSVTFTVDPSGGLAPYTYAWSSSPAQSGCTANGANFTCTPTTYGYVYATVRVNDSLGKSFTPKTLSVDFNPQLRVTSGFTSVAQCGAGEANLTAAPSGGSRPYVVTWTFPDGTTATGATVQHSFAATGTNYSVGLSVTDALGVTVTSTTYVELTACSSGSGGGSGLPVLPIVGAVVLLLLVIAVFAVLTMRRRSGGDGEEDLGPAGAPAAPPAGDDSAPEDDLWGADQKPAEEVPDGMPTQAIPEDPADAAGSDTWPPTSK